MTRRLNALCAVALPTYLMIALPTAVDAACAKDWIDIEAIEDDGGSVELYAVNPRRVPIALTVRVWLSNMVSDRSRTVSQTIPPKTSELVMVLNEIDENKQSRYGFECRWTVGSIDARHDERVLYQLPYELGKSYYVLQGYGSRLSHTGREQYTVDFYMPEGTPVHAARGGIVAQTESSHSKGCWRGGCEDFANYIVILHDDWTTGEYYHLKKDGVLVDVGDRVVAGQKIGLSGNTGNSTMPHLHFGVYRAAPWGNFQSVPVQFTSVDGIVRNPRRGGRYQAVAIETSGYNAPQGDAPALN